MSKKTPAEEADQLRLVVQDAHSALKDLTRVIREARAVIGDVQKAAKEAVDNDLGEAVKAGLEEYTDAIQKRIKEAEAAVDERFDTIADILLGEDSQSVRSGKRSLAEYAAMKRNGDIIPPPPKEAP